MNIHVFICLQAKIYWFKMHSDGNVFNIKVKYLMTFDF